MQPQQFNPVSLKTASWAGIALLMTGVILTAWDGRWGASAIIMGMLAISVWLVGRDRRLPDFLDCCFVAVSVFNTGGYVFDLYVQPHHFDKVAHGLSGFAISITLGVLAYWPLLPALRHFRWRLALAIATFGMAAGTVWEVAEWVLGFIGSLHDTVLDLAADGLGALLAGLAVAAWQRSAMMHQQLHAASSNVARQTQPAAPTTAAGVIHHTHHQQL